MAAPHGVVAQFARFGLVGLANTAISTVIILALTWAGWNPFAANVAGYVAGTLFSFYSNSRWTFGARIEGARLVKFVIVILVSYGINVAVLALALAAGWGDLASQVPAMVCFTLFNFIGQRQWTFKDRGGSPP